MKEIYKFTNNLSPPIIDHMFANEFRNECTTFKSFFQKRVSKDIYQKWTFTKKTMILLEAAVRRCS